MTQRRLVFLDGRDCRCGRLERKRAACGGCTCPVLHDRIFSGEQGVCEWFLLNDSDGPLVISICRCTAMLDEYVGDGEIDVEVLVGILLVENFLDNQWSVVYFM